jgi:bifunctional non-homologous end joining protein LigD
MDERVGLVKGLGDAVEIGGRKVPLSNLDKLMWKREGITKADVIQYYTKVASRMIPLIKNRPLMLNRFPHGVPGQSFVQKDWPNHPDWVKIAPVASESQRKSVRHVVCNDEATLVWLADMACLEINQFLSTAPKTDWHDLLLVDLDPYPPATFEDAVEIAVAVHSALKEMKLRHMIKTSGSEGFHFLVPIVPKYPIETIRKFVLLLGVLLEDLAPNRVSTSRNRSQRVGKIYIDFFQNGLQKTIAAPFSLRPEPGAPVSLPLDPKRLKTHFKPSDFNLHTVPALLKRDGVPVFDASPDQTLDRAFREMGVELGSVGGPGEI